MMRVDRLLQRLSLRERNEKRIDGMAAVVPDLGTYRANRHSVHEGCYEHKARRRESRKRAATETPRDARTGSEWMGRHRHSPKPIG